MACGDEAECGEEGRAVMERFDVRESAGPLYMKCQGLKAVWAGAIDLSEAEGLVEWLLFAARQLFVA